MDSAEKQLADTLKELMSRNRAKVILESGFYGLILLFLFVGNFLTLLVMLLNRQMQTIPKMRTDVFGEWHRRLGRNKSEFSLLVTILDTLPLSYRRFVRA